MGLFRAGIGAMGGVLADQWRDYFYCESISQDLLVKKGQKRVSRRSSNRQGEENIISNGSILAINDGQCMIIVEQGKIVDLCAEPGEFVYDASTEPTVLYGNLGEGIRATFANIGKRFTFGGDPGKDQRIYYFNTKEIMGNRYGTPNPVPFRVVDNNIGLDIDISIRCHGEYSYKISDPLLFYTNVCGNVSDAYPRSQIDSQLKTELMTALQPAFAKISTMGIRYSALPGHTLELTQALREVLTQKWDKLRGVSIVSMGINSVKASDEDEKMIKELQRNAVLRDPTMAAATLAGSQAQAMQDAAKNASAGPVMAFAGMQMAQGAGGMNAQDLYNLGQQREPQTKTGWDCPCGSKNNKGKFCMLCGKPQPAPESTWTCSCGAKNTSNFCSECAKPRPAQEGWSCSCGMVNKGKFCMECGKPRPAGAPFYQCDKCGWKPQDPVHPPKFCPECGDVFNAEDLQNS